MIDYLGEIERKLIFLLDKMNLAGKYLGEGNFAVAYRSDCGERVYKLTIDVDDALQAQEILGTSPKFFAEVYQVMEISEGLFFIETQYYKPCSEYTWSQYYEDIKRGKGIIGEEMIKYGFLHIDNNFRNFGRDKEGNIRCFDFGYNSSARLYENAKFKKYELQ